MIITRTVSGLLRERFQDYYENGFRIIMSGFRLLRERFQIITRMLLERFEDVWERFVVTMQDVHR